MKIHARPKRFWSWSYVLERAGRRLATVDPSWFRERAAIEIAEERYRLVREGRVSGRFELRCGLRVVASATKPSAFRRRFEVTTDGRRLELQAESPFTRRFVVRENRRVVGSVRPDGVFTRHATIDMPGDLDAAVCVFLFALVTFLWRRAQESS